MYSVLPFAMADLRSRGECRCAFGGSGLTGANPRLGAEVSLISRKSYCLGAQKSQIRRRGIMGAEKIERCLDLRGKVCPGPTFDTRMTLNEKIGRAHISTPFTPTP